MAKIRIKGDTSGYIDIAAPAVAGSVTLNLPTSDATFMTTAGGTFTSGINVTGTVTADGLTVDTNTLHVDAANNRVGIGTTSPSAPLTINAATADADGALGSQSPQFIIHGGNTNNPLEIGMDNSGGTAVGFIQSRNLVSGAQYLSLNPNGGNVGIGTSSPSAKLHTLVSSGANKLIIQNTAASQQSVLQLNTDSTTPGQCQIYMGKTSAPTNGQVGYDPNSDYLYLYTNNTERMRIDSSGNLLVGTTSTGVAAGGSGTSGINIRPVAIEVARSGDPLLFLNRTTSDGDIVQFRKNGSTVGSIGVVNNNNPFIANDADNSGLQFGTNQIIPHYDSLQRDNAVDLGSSSVRFKDLYLSGGVYVGGTGAANKLDDYEEGTWTPEPTSGSWSGYNITGHYVKVGRMVSIIVNVQNVTIDSSASTSNQIRNLPFTNGSKRSATSQITYYNTFDDVNTVGLIEESQSVISFLEIRASNSWVGSNFRNSNNCYIHLTATYYTDY